jgi:hypothetical protein
MGQPFCSLEEKRNFNPNSIGRATLGQGNIFGKEAKASSAQASNVSYH